MVTIDYRRLRATAKGRFSPDSRPSPGIPTTAVPTYGPSNPLRQSPSPNPNRKPTEGYCPPSHTEGTQSFRVPRKPNPRTQETPTWKPTGPPAIPRRPYG